MNDHILKRLNLSKRTKNVLSNIDKDILGLTPYDLLTTYNLGIKSLTELTNELKKINLSLKTVS